jgi:hypothetical protein
LTHTTEGAVAKIAKNYKKNSTLRRKLFFPEKTVKAVLDVLKDLGLLIDS